MRGLGHGLERRSRGGRGMIARIFVFMWIPHQISCGIHMIMIRAAVRTGVGAGQRGRVPAIPDMSDKSDGAGAKARREGGLDL